jgi:hypothetical protein
MKMYAVFLHESLPKPFLELISGYLHNVVGQKFLSVAEVVHLAAFLECHLIENAEDKKPWVVQIPIGYVLAIADMQEGKHSLGFHRS